MVTELWYLAFLALVGGQRLVEVGVSRRHAAQLRARGGIEHALQQMPWMVAIHVGWLVSCALEVLCLNRPFSLALAPPALVLFGLGQVLRVSAMRALGTRWTVTVMTLPGEGPVTTGPFRFLRHPNYLGVVLEIFALPLVHGAYLTSIVFSIANGVLLARRIRAEEQALASASDYRERFRGRPRLWPGG